MINDIKTASERKNSDAEKLYGRLLTYAEKLHRDNKRRITGGFISFVALPVLLTVLLVMTNSSRIVFLLLWIVFMFIAASYIIAVAYVDKQLQIKLDELSAIEEKEYDDILYGGNRPKCCIKASELHPVAAQDKSDKSVKVKVRAPAAKEERK